MAARKSAPKTVASQKAARTKAVPTKTGPKKVTAKKVAANNPTSTRQSPTQAAVKPSARSRGVTVQAYLAGLPPAHASIGRRLDAIAASEVGSPGTIKWGQPVWESGGPVAYMRGASRHVTFGFWRGAELADPDGKLEGEGTRMRHLRIASLGDLDEALVRRLLREAVARNVRQGDPTRTI